MCWVATVADLHFAGGGRIMPLSVIRRTGARRMNLRVDPRSGAVRLTLPRSVPLSHALQWVEEKRSWVEAQIEGLPIAEPIGPGTLISLGDEQYRLEWNPRFARTPKIVGQLIEVGGPEDQLAGRVLRWLKRQALDRLTAETHRVAARAGVVVTKVGVGDPATRWGSCSSSGAIRYSWRLILAPDHVLRATVAHEVAHRVHMNHGPRFHALTAELFGGDPVQARRWLRANGQALQGFGRG